MTAQIIQFVPRPNPHRDRTLEQQAMEIMNVALLTPCEIGMEPVIGIPFYESSLGYVDTAPSELNPDSA